MPWNSEGYSRLWIFSTILSTLFTAASAYWGYVAHRLDFVAAVGGSDIFSRFVAWTLPLLPLVGTVISPTPQRMGRPSNSMAMAYGAIARIFFSLCFTLLVYGMTMQTGAPGAIFFTTGALLLGAAIWTFIKASRIERGAGSIRSASAAK